MSKTEKKKIPIDTAELEREASNHQQRVEIVDTEMKLARANSGTAHLLADGVKEHKGQKKTSAQKEQMQEALPHITKMANTQAVKRQPKIKEMKKAEKNADKAEELAAGVREVKGEKKTNAQKEHMQESLPHISKMANTHAVKVQPKIKEMEKAEANSETAETLAAGVREVKGERIEKKTKEKKTELNKVLSGNADDCKTAEACKTAGACKK